jgi:putative ABC transport system permease protein
VFKVAWSSLKANKLRLLLTSFAIVLGVAFVAGSFVFTDTISARFDSLFEDISAGVDVYVDPQPPEFGNDLGQVQVSMPEDVYDDVLGVDGVLEAEKSVAGIAQLVDQNGEVIGGFGPPTLGFSWSGNPDLSPLRIAPENGRPPEGPGEIVLDIATAETNNFAIGDTISLIVDGPVQTFTLVGLANFGTEDNLAGATLAIFEFSEAQRLFDLEGRISQISIAGTPDVTPEELATRVAAAVPDDLDVTTGEQSTENNAADIKEALGFLTTALLVFAMVAIFVGSFVIYNTFRIIVAQRTRELALLRAIGATGRQVTRMVVLEAFIVAVVSSAIGVLGGVGLAIMLAKGMEAAGFGLPEGPLTVLPRTVIVGMLVGIIVTVMASIFPAIRASRIPPIAAMRADLVKTTRRSLQKRTIAGVVVTGLGALGIAVGLFTSIDNALAILGFGALVAFLGVSILAPIAARPFASFIGWPIRKVYRIAGDLAVQNTQRQPRRTASTASALMIGVALVVFVAILAASLKGSVAKTVEESFPADLSASSSTFTIGVSPQYSEDLRLLPEIGGVTTLNATEIKVGEDVVAASAIEPDTSEGVLSIKGVDAAELAALSASNGALIYSKDDEPSAAVGTVVTIELPNGVTGDAEIVGTFDDNANFGEYVITRERYFTGIDPRTDAFVLANAADGVSISDAQAAAELAAEPFPNVQVQTQSELVEQFVNGINVLLGLFTVLLALAIIIAILGITNTLALSIIERTREIGLLRAVGMSRRQLRRMIRWESVIIAVFGAILGMITGVILGWAVVQALKDEGVGTFSIPTTQLIILVLVAGLAGILAAIYPAYKASRLNILDAISYE